MLSPLLWSCALRSGWLRVRRLIRIRAMTIPPVSRRDAPKFKDATHRTATAASYQQDIDGYHDLRPGYSDQVIELIPGGRILDVGCGTGKLTAPLLARGDQVFGLDPSLPMLRHYRELAPCWQATAESTGLVDACVDTICCAQTWHWVDYELASAELARVSTPNARLILVWNSLDVSIAWVHRLSRIMHAGDTLKEGFYPPFAQPWNLEHTLRTRFKQTLQAADIFALTATRSFWLRATEQTRAKMTKNLEWYLYEHLGFSPQSTIDVPYRVDAFVLRKHHRA